MLQNVRPANRNRLSVVLAGFLVLQTFLPLLGHQSQWQWVAHALVWMTLGAILIGVSLVTWLRPGASVSVKRLQFLVVAATVGFPMGVLLYWYGPKSVFSSN